MAGTRVTEAQHEGGREPVAAVQSVDRALSILEILARRGVAGVTEIAVELGVHKSTASRLVSVLEARGFVEQLADRGKYQLGFAVVRLAGSRGSDRDLAAEGHRLCEALATDIGETVNVAILAGDRAVNISQVRGPCAISVQNWVGQSTPLHATSSGKVLLAHAPGVDLEQLLGPELPRYTDRTITDVRTLDGELERVRRRGFATTVEEYEVALNAAAAPVRDHTGKVIAAVSVSGPSYRLTPGALEGVAQRLVTAVAGVSRRLGHTD
jgi:DNA-binding IclR family transcriptional regulator